MAMRRQSLTLSQDSSCNYARKGDEDVVLHLATGRVPKINLPIVEIVCQAG